MALTNIDINKKNREIVREILKQIIPNYEVWAFGSRVTGKAKKYSDLDLVIISDTPIPLDIRAELVEAFSESDLPWKVDIVDWTTTTEKFRSIIKRDKVVISGEILL
jgi:type I restriction enzyme S subunit